ncbi:MAG TPA: hypothetical protein PLD20_27460 [Blastocatellia bacterium]|nr:hypothetical protein [Blastocatellia bacterium]HMV84212.1 hypothetical protein [Blastocatellia bacterium]HMX26675.1 hypothetical protein [Blastocatellia bacterium]HMY73255.1 hypothetical protein [Blastocatellia bacterium]HMZ21700.1 hypothetical protein [Blastocatellia bacterium]
MPFFKSRGPSKGRGSGGGSNRSGGGGRPGGGGRGGRSGGGGRPGGGRPFGKKKSSKKKRFSKKKAAKKATLPTIDNTGMEGWYFRELVQTEKLIHVKLTNGEEFDGFVRYYDKDTISVEPDDGSPKMFIRKDGLRYLYEVDEE